MDRPLAVLSDFDGTITVEDVAEVLLARFATGEWEEIERLNRAGVLGTRETMARQFAIVHATREELSDCFRREARMDPAVLAHVDQGDDPRGQGERGALDGLGRAQERDD